MMNWMHPEQATLWQAICDAPHDDAPRLIYSDWLEENDDIARAEFIRQQVIWYRQQQVGLLHTPSQTASEATFTQLEQEHRKKWWRPLHQFLNNARFQRGFISPTYDSMIYRSFPQLARYYQSVIPEWNLIMECGSNRLAHYASQECFQQVVSLELISDIPNPTNLRPFLNAPNLLHIHHLGLQMDRIFTGHLEVMLDSPLPAQLRSFAITRESSILFSHLHRSLQSVRFPLMNVLRLEHQHINAETLLAIDSHIPIKQLTELHLAHNDLDDAAVEYIVRKTTQLHHLDLSNNDLLINSATFLANWPGLNNLRCLNIMNSAIDERGIVLILRSPMLNPRTQLRVNIGMLSHPVREEYEQHQHKANLPT